MSVSPLSALCSPLILAAADMPEPTSYAALGWIIAGVFGIVGLANQGMALWDRLFPRATPPAHELYATKEELQQAKEEHQASDARIEKRFEDWMEQQQTQHTENMAKLDETIDRFAAWQLTMERALGVIGTKADIALEAKSGGRRA
ncbi:MAG: hypothetical protein HS117_19400 [Verrucomicrobiaceae bacterium]|nr:hypothetical protein [Verrucomicrobiaceae bacterium]